MKFIHAADLHLGSPFKGLTQLSASWQEKVQEALTTAFDRLVKFAIQEEVDFIILAGDEFDQVDRDLHSQLYLRQKFQELGQQKIVVFMIYGNHDYLTSSSAMISWPDNVHVFGPQVTTKVFTAADQTRVALTGFSYDQNHIRADRLGEYPNRLAEVDYQIGLLHGQLGKEHQGDYAPFTLAELRSKGYDYWALGHIHKREILSQDPWIVYPGNLQGRHRNEAGAKGFYLVTVQRGQTRLDFQACAPVIWQNQTCSVAGVQDLDGLLQKLRAAIISPEQTLVELTLEDSSQLTVELQQRLSDPALLENLQTTNNYVYRLQLAASALQAVTQLDLKFWQQAAQKVFTSEQLADLLNQGKLQNNPLIRSLIQDPQFLKSVQERAQNFINQPETEV
ncbi:DNA repair exonuclease [Lactobacillus sp. DCY120]|uniref:DNA repair exonuclease n=1 Tax=Bombilactobacillus apium TaxID=2675299 RepID=A0A850QYF7_9LACO|nr:DNA repair exonuclease [Bombilactobacillus apium]NVY96874.1 DNA repair exonuclease [Bombilactobacillus apium]